MHYLAILILGALVGYAVAQIGQFIDGLDRQYGSECNQNCRQGRDCTCCIADNGG